MPLTSQDSSQEYSPNEGSDQAFIEAMIQPLAPLLRTSLRAFEEQLKGRETHHAIALRIVASSSFAGKGF